MHDSIEADLIAAHNVPFARDVAGWTDAYITSMSRLDPETDPRSAEDAARTAWQSHGWAHPAVVAALEHALGPLSAE